MDRIQPRTPAGPRFTPRELPEGGDVAAYVARGVSSAGLRFQPGSPCTSAPPWSPPDLERVAVGGRMRHANGMPETPVVNCVLLWARPGMEAALSAYEAKVLRLVAEHGGRVLERGTVMPGSQHDGEPPTEVQFLEMPSQASLDAYMNDPRRLAMAAERDAAIARTDLFRIQPVSRPVPGY